MRRPLYARESALVPFLQKGEYAPRAGLDWYGEEYLLLPPVFKPPAVQPATSRCTNSAIQAPWIMQSLGESIDGPQLFAIKSSLYFV